MRVLATLAITLFFFAVPVDAHVGSPNVFYDADAGPYHLFVTVNVPAVIPGVADIQIRADSDDIELVSTAVTRLAGAGSQYAPVPDIAQRSAVDPHLFTSGLWLMEYGSMRVMINVTGRRGTAQMSVPVPSAARKMLPMPPGLGALLLALAIGLALGAISIVGAAARESDLAPGAPLTPARKRRGWRAMAFMAVFVGLVFYFAFAWWNADAKNYAAITKIFKPPRLALGLVDGSRLKIRPSPDDTDWLKLKVMDTLAPDHGHLMHLFLVREPGLDRMYHLHPAQQQDGSFVDKLPSVDSGRYSVFADIVSEKGFPWTLVGTIDLPQTSGEPLAGDDSEGTAAPLIASSDTAVDTLLDGTRVIWRRNRSGLSANLPTFLRFEVQDRDGNPATDLEPYMGMAAHAEIIRSDLQVFAHIHPSGSVPMAALMMASVNTDLSAKASRLMNMSDMDMPGINKTGAKMPAMSMSPASAAAKVSPDLSMPYGFPTSGHYRIFLQFKRRNQIETAHFDALVN